MTISHAIALCKLLFFFFNDTATTEIYTLSLHDALPISAPKGSWETAGGRAACRSSPSGSRAGSTRPRSEEHTSELQSHSDLVCRLLLEKKKSDIQRDMRLSLQQRKEKYFQTPAKTHIAV